MSSELAVRLEAEIVSGSVRRVPYGLEVADEISKEDWTDTFLAVKDIESLSQWYIGDLMVKAKQKWAGEMYETMMKSTGYEYQTLANYLNTASSYSHQEREFIYNEIFTARGKNTKLGISHFQAAAPLMSNDDTKRTGLDFLVQAGKQGWTRDELRQQIEDWKIRTGRKDPTREKSIGVITFGEQMREFFKGYMPNLTQERYDEKSWLLEVHDVIEERLHELGIEL